MHRPEWRSLRIARAAVFGGVTTALRFRRPSVACLLSSLSLWVGAVLILVASGSAADFSRYQVILDRMPFGAEAPPVAPGTDPSGKPPPPAESFTKNLKMCAVTRHALTGRLQVGLVDTVSKKNYFLTVGDTEDGITLVDADYDNEKAVLRKGDQEASMSMSDVATMAAVNPVTPAPVPGGGMPVPMPVASRPGMPALPGGSLSPPRTGAVSVAPPAVPAGATMGGVMPLTPSAASGNSRTAIGNSDPRTVINAPTPVIHAERLNPKLTGEALKKHLEQYQLDLIRAGGAKGPPLPMQLTPEMDQQLVKEGVLPPMPTQ